MVDFDSDTLSKILISEEVYAMLLNHFGMKDSPRNFRWSIKICSELLSRSSKRLSGEEGSSTNELSYLSGEQILKTPLW